MNKVQLLLTILNRQRPSYPLPKLSPQLVNIKGIGIDIISIQQITRLINGNDRQTLNLLFSSLEIDYCQSSSHPYQNYALCFATKEAVGKALGTGLAGIGWNEIEVNITQSNLLKVGLQGNAKIQATKQEIKQFFATWCYWDQHILVHVLAH